MYNKIKSGYDLFIRELENNDLIGTLTLKGEKDDYKDIDPVDSSDMKFVKKYKFIYDMIKEGYALFISYEKDDYEFFVSIREKAKTGPYQDTITWNHIIVSQKKELDYALQRLDKKIEEKIEGSMLK